MLSLSCQAALRGVIYLAGKPDPSQKTGIREIAGAIGASEHTTAKILQQLARRGIVQSVRGPGGGFSLSRKQMKEPLFSIVEAIDGPEPFQECGLGLSSCSAKHPCPIHDSYKEARTTIRNYLEKTRPLELSRKLGKGKTFLSDQPLP